MSLRRAQLRRDAALLVLLAAAVGLAAARIQPWSGLGVLLAMSVVPGAAVLTLAGPVDRLTFAALAVGISLAIDTAVASLLAATGFWNPGWAAACLGCSAAGLLLADLRRMDPAATAPPAA